MNMCGDFQRMKRRDFQFVCRETSSIRLFLSHRSRNIWVWLGRGYGRQAAKTKEHVGRQQNQPVHYVDRGWKIVLKFHLQVSFFDFFLGPAVVGAGKDIYEVGERVSSSEDQLCFAQICMFAPLYVCAYCTCKFIIELRKFMFAKRHTIRSICWTNGRANDRSCLYHG